MRNKKRILTTMLVAWAMAVSTAYAATGESIGASINGQEYKLSSKIPITPQGGKAKVSTACGNYSGSDSVQSVIWYTTNNAQRTLGQCNTKKVVNTISKGQTITSLISLNSATTFYTIGVYAGKCILKKDASESSGIGSTLATNCN